MPCLRAEIVGYPKGSRLRKKGEKGRKGRRERRKEGKGGKREEGGVRGVLMFVVLLFWFWREGEEELLWIFVVGFFKKSQTRIFE